MAESTRMGAAERLQKRLAAGWQAIERNDPRSAEEIAAEVLRRHPRDTESLRLFGTSLFFQGRFREAAAPLSEVFKGARIHGVGYQLGHCYLEIGDPVSAAAVLAREVQAFPDSIEAYSLLGIALAQQSKHQEALSVLASAIERNPQSAGAYVNLGSVLTEMGRHEDAIPQFRKAIELHPDLSQAHNNLGSAYNALGRHDAAIECYRQALRIAPGDFEVHNNLGNVLEDLGRHEEAAASYRAALAIDPNYAPAYSGLGTAFGSLGRYAEAMDCFQRALALRPDYAEAHSNLGVAFQRQKRFDEAVACHRRAISIDPRCAQAYVNLGSVYLETKNLDDAVACYREAVSANPDLALACTLLGAVYRKLGRFSDAIACHERALSIDPGLAEAHTNLGAVYQLQQRFDEAIACHQKAIALKPALAEALANLGAVYQEQQRPGEAMAWHQRALALKPDNAGALHNLGLLLQNLGRHREAIDCFQRALSFEPDRDYTLSALAASEWAACVWENVDARVEALRKSVREQRSVVDPFTFLAVSQDAGEQRLCAERCVRDKVPGSVLPLFDGIPYRHQRIRLAYLSADFHAHATAYLIAGLFESHDRTRFETVGISYGPDSPSSVRARLLQSFDRVVDARSKSDAEVATLLREMEVDIAIDLKGHTKDSRPGILAHRPAPIQVNYLGYPGTLGAEFIDYILADRFVLPEDHQVFYSEKAAYLPDCYQVNDSRRKIAERTPSRLEAGLPNDSFVFCCFNNNYKIMPRVFDVWTRLLERIPRSVLWLLRDNDWAEENLRKEAQARGVDPGRLIFAPRMNLEEHLARHRLADLFLDTLPYNAHTTASDALWSGLPVLTCAGKTFAGRVAGSLLLAVGLPELVTSNFEEYEALALKLATEAGPLNEIRRKLERNRLTASLFDTDRFRRHVESAYSTMWQIWQRGEQPRTFSVDPI